MTSSGTGQRFSVPIFPELIFIFSSDAGGRSFPKTLIYLALTELSLPLSLSQPVLNFSTHLQVLKCHFYLPVPFSAHLYPPNKLPNMQLVSEPLNLSQAANHFTLLCY